MAFHSAVWVMRTDWMLTRAVCPKRHALFDGTIKSLARYGDRMIRRLLLWDVDGTLVRAGDLGAAVFDLALEGVLGLRPATRVRMSGKTDPQIVSEYLAQLDVDRHDERPDELVESILQSLEKHLAEAADAGHLAAGG